MKVVTVLGPIEPDAVGQTLTHEHIHMNYKNCFVEPKLEDHKKKSLEPGITLKNLGYVRQYPYSHLYNLSFGDEDVATMVEEVKEYKRLGGETLVEVTTTGIDPDYDFLKEVSKETGVNIVCSTGYYLGHTLSDKVLSSSIESLVESMVHDLKIGRNGIKAGCIGEIGCQFPIADSERRSLIAAAKAQAQVGCPLIIHPGREESSPFEIIDILRVAGADLSKTVMSHLDRTFIPNSGRLLEFANYSPCYLEFDLFGIEVSHFQNNENFDFLSDAQRIQEIKLLIKHGYEDRIVIAHDVHTRHRLLKYGGHGYGHILENVVPKMLSRGITQEVIEKILIDNPKRWLAF